jgi:asparagine synthase (glutamine-hydrolysing)
VLLDAIGSRLPAALLTRGKMGFGVPLAAWFRGPLREMVADHLLGRQFLERGMVSAPFVRHLIEEHQSGRRDNNHWLWRLLMLELWFREWGAGTGEAPQGVIAQGACNSAPPAGAC